MKSFQALMWGEVNLNGLLHSNPAQEALWLLNEAMAEKLESKPFQTLSNEEWVHYQTLVQKRKEGTPLAYLTKSVEFMGLELIVTESSLIPRPETEILGNLACQSVETIENPKVLEIGTGCGALAILLAHKYKGASIVATDISKKALSLAKRNGLNFKVDSQISFLEGSLYQVLSSNYLNFFDCILSNPPYIRSSQIKNLQLEIQREPRIALDGGKDGLEVIYPIVDGSKHFLKPQGCLLLEIGEDQANQVIHRMEINSFRSCKVIQDLEGKNRVVQGVWNG